MNKLQANDGYCEKCERPIIYCDHAKEDFNTTIKNLEKCRKNDMDVITREEKAKFFGE